MFVKYTCLLLLVLLALTSDIRTYRIKNEIVLVFIAAGLIINPVLDGLTGLVNSLLAMLIPIPLLIFFYAARMLGAGDIKLFCAVGAIGGIKFVLYTLAYSFISGGVIAAIIMLVNKSFRQRAKYLATYLKTCFLTGSIKPYTDFSDKSDGAKFPFSCAVACGAVIAAFYAIL